MKTISVIGLGNRGFEYMNFLKYFHRKETKVVAICDISPRALEDVGKRFKIGTNLRFSSADDFFKQGVLSDGLIISTQDKTHFEITKNAILAGYKYILLEKPVSDNIEECETLDRLAKENNVQLVVCHVLRYATYYRK
ncbi:MAG: Gfo/Idh/MocA family oxidoreductase, partial [Clostridia bacterium]|nr:Gfo/Idh/MocA family oxidoreductase [Clostridia bacterium]